MKYQSRTEFMFNIREFAESLHAEDIKVLDIGLGLGEIQKAKASPLNHSAPENVGQASEAPVSKQVVGHTPNGKGLDHWQTNEQISFQAPPAPAAVKSQATGRKSFSATWLLRLFLRLGGHVLDLAVILTFGLVSIVFIKRVAGYFDLQVIHRVENQLQIFSGLPLWQAGIICLVGIYTLFLFYWISFRIVGLKTPGASFLVEAPKSGVRV